MAVQRPAGRGSAHRTQCVRRADRRAADLRGRVRVLQVRPGRARHQQHRLPGSAALGRGGRLPGARGGRHRHFRGRGDATPIWRHASSVLLVCFEPEEEAGTVFLRLRKANRKHGLASWTLAPFLSNGARKIGAQLIPALPGAEATTLDGLGHPPTWRSLDEGEPAGITLDATSVIIVGERAAGPVRHVERLPTTQRARPAPGWPGFPRRAGDRGALDAGCLPNLLPGGRPLADAAARVDTQTTWGIASLPTLEGRDADEMLMSAADRRAGGLDRRRGRPQRLRRSPGGAGGAGSRRLRGQPGDPGLAGHRARRRGVPGLPDPRAGRQLRELGGPGPAVRRRHPAAERRCPTSGCWPRWPTGSGSTSASAPPPRPGPSWTSWGPGRVPAEPDRPMPPARPAEPTRNAQAVCWPAGGPHLDGSRALDGEPYLTATAPPAGRPGQPGHGGGGRAHRSVVVSNDRGSLTWPLVVDPEMIDGVVWLPSRAPG